MLEPEYLEALPNALIALYSQAETDILCDMARRINTYDYWIPAAEHQRKKLLEMGMVHENILKALSGITGRSDKELKRLMEEAGIRTIRSDYEIYGKACIETSPLQASPELISVLNSGYRTTKQTFKNLTGTTANTATKQFEDALDRAWMQIQTGGFDYNAAIRNAVKDLSRQGVAVIKYHSGHKDTLEVAVYGTGAGLCGWNCRHNFRPYLEGVLRTYSTDLLKSYEEKRYTYNGKSLTEYEATQAQRQIERNIRRWKREFQAMKAAGLDSSEAEGKILYWNDVQNDFLNQTGMKRQTGREQTANAIEKKKQKEIIKVHKTLASAAPNVVTEVRGTKGGISRNYYDETGKWVKQITNNDHGNPKKHPYGLHGEHAHDIIWKDGKIVERRTRELTKEERKENQDIL